MQSSKDGQKKHSRIDPKVSAQKSSDKISSQPKKKPKQKTSKKKEAKEVEVYGPVQPPHLRNSENSSENKKSKETKRKDKKGKKSPAKKKDKAARKAFKANVAAKKVPKPKKPSSFRQPLTLFYILRNGLWTIGMVLILISSAYLFTSRQNLNHFGRDIERYAFQELGLDLIISGNVGLITPIINPGIFMEDVSLMQGTAFDGAGPNKMTKLDRVELRLNLGSFFEGEQILNLIQIHLKGIDVKLNSDEGGVSDLEEITSMAETVLKTSPTWLGEVGLDKIALVDSRLIWQREETQEPIVVPVQELQFKAEGSDMQLFLSGRAGNEAFTIGGAFSDAEALLNGGSASVDLTGALGTSFLVASGDLSASKTEESDLLVQVVGPDFTGIAGMLGTYAPSGQPFSLSTQLQGNLWKDFSGTIEGDAAGSSILGHVSMNLGEVPRFDLNLSVGQLSLLSAAPIFAQSFLPLMMGDTVWKGSINLEMAEVWAGEKELGSGEINLVAKEDEMSLMVIQGGEETGYFMGSGVFKTGEEASSTIEASAAKFDMGAVLTSLNPEWDIDATLDMAAEFTIGDEEVTFVETLDGGLQMLLVLDRIDGDLLTWLPDDVSDLIKKEGIISTSEDTTEEAMCVLSSALFDRGRVLTQGFYLETDDFMTSASGYMDFAADDVKMVLRPRPKDPRLLSNAVDIEVGGAITDPKVKRNDRNVSRGLSGSMNVITSADEKGALPRLSVGGEPHDCLKGLLGQE